jgi:hypothetical protein
MAKNILTEKFAKFKLPTSKPLCSLRKSLALFAVKEIKIYPDRKLFPVETM